MREDWNFRSATGAICVFLFFGILIATLAPFHHPANGVTWMNTGGLRFQGYGTVLSSGLGNQHDAWEGEIRGLAVYDRELAPAEASQHYQHWAKTGRLPASAAESSIAVYYFDERQGRVVNNRVAPAEGRTGTALVIPE